MHCVAVIPARAGSKRIPGKNIKPFRGKPIIAYSIEAALESNLFSQVIVSTDSMAIAEVATQYGAIVRQRPPELADDHTGTQAVMAHVLQALLAHDIGVELACCIYPTAPFIQGPDLLRGRDALTSDRRFSYAFSVTTYEFPIERALRIRLGGAITADHPEYRDTRSQDLMPAYHDAGHWYWGRPHAFINDEVLYSEKSIAVEIPRQRVQDIDTLEDWDRAELMHQALWPWPDKKTAKAFEEATKP